MADGVVTAAGAALVDRSQASRSPAIDRALSVLELLSAEPGGMRMADVARALHLPKSTTFVVLETLEARRYVDRDAAGTFRLGLKVFGLASAVLSQLDIRQVARPHLEDLSQRTGLTTHLAILDGRDVIYLDKVEGDGLVRFDTYVGKRATVNLTAVGKALAIYLADERIDAILDATFQRGTERSPARPFQFKEQLADFRRLGFTIEDEEDVPGVYCVAAPIRNSNGDVVAAVGVIGLKRDLADAGFDGLGAQLKSTALQISTRLGYHADVSDLPAGG